MRVLRVRYGELIFYGSLIEGHVVCLDRTLGLKEPIPLAEIVPLAPVTPTKIVCAGLNYREHAREMGKPEPEEPVIFLKPPSAVITAGSPIRLPAASARVDFEGELAVVIGKTCRKVSPERVAEHFFGYCCANDVTARDLQAKDGQYGRAKGFDSFAPLGPWIETQAADPNHLRLRTLVNGEVRQEADTSDMIFSVERLASFISGVMTLHPGDVILTGTPSGVGPLSPGDEVTVEITGVGVLTNPVTTDDGVAPGAVIQ